MVLATIFAVIFALLFGLAFTFYGLRVFLVMLPVWGFFAGYWIGAQFVSLFTGAGFLGSGVGFVVGLAVGIAFAILSYQIFEFGVVVVTAVFGIAVGTGLMQALGFDSGIAVALGALVIAVLVAWLLFRYDQDRYLVVVMTALGGASLLVAGGLLILGRISTDQIIDAGNTLGPILRDSWLWLLVWLVLAAVGILVQVRTNREFDWRKNDLVQGWS